MSAGRVAIGVGVGHLPAGVERVGVRATVAPAAIRPASVGAWPVRAPAAAVLSCGHLPPRVRPVGPVDVLTAGRLAALGRATLHLTPLGLPALRLAGL